MTTKGPETFHHRQIQKLHRFLSPNSGGLKLNLMLATLPSIRGSGIDFEKLEIDYEPKNKVFLDFVVNFKNQVSI